MKSKRYQELVKKIDKKKEYTIEEAIKLVKETASTKFDASVEVHMRLGIDPKKGEQAVRGSVILPHGTGKTKKVAVFSGDDGKELIKEIKSSGKLDFDIALATPEIMKDLAGIAKILGPRGLMPSPKAGTVVSDKEMPKAIEEIKKGKISFKNDDTANLHQIIGKASWDDKKLVENYLTLTEVVKKSKPSAAKGVFMKNIYLSSSMGPSVKVLVG